MYYIGVDLGTSAVKLLLMEADGTIRNVVSKEYPLYFPIRAGRNEAGGLVERHQNGEVRHSGTGAQEKPGEKVAGLETSAVRCAVLSCWMKMTKSHPVLRSSGMTEGPEERGQTT